jgi:hypothetical protein
LLGITVFMIFWNSIKIPEGPGFPYLSLILAQIVGTGFVMSIDSAMVG